MALGDVGDDELGGGGGGWEQGRFLTWMKVIETIRLVSVRWRE